MLHSIDHVNLVVADLDRMIAFYESAMGMRVTKRVTISGEWIDQVVGLRGAQGDVVYLELPSGPRVELIRYHQPTTPRPDSLGQSNVPGIRHIAFKVDDIDATVERLKHAGVEFLSPVQLVPDAQVTYAGGVRKQLVYFRDPEGNLLELCEYKSAAS